MATPLTFGPAASSQQKQNKVRLINPSVAHLDGAGLAGMLPYAQKAALNRRPRDGGATHRPVEPPSRCAQRALLYNRDAYRS